MKRHTLFLAGISGLALVFGLLLFTGCDLLEGDNPTHTVSFDTNGGEGTVPSTMTVEEGESIWIPSGSELTKEGYYFDGWNTKADGTGDRYGPGITYAGGNPSFIYEDTTLYANWRPLPVVSYDANGGVGTVPPSQTGLPYREKATVAGGNGLTKEGYWFNGWNTEADGSGTAYTDGVSLTFPLDENITLYAQWVDLAVTRYTVTYDANGISGAAPSSQEALYGSAVTLKTDSGLTMSGYAFSGWNTKADGTGTAYAAGDSYTVTGDITLYAQWTELYTVRYNEGSSSYSSTLASVSLPPRQQVESGSIITVGGDNLVNAIYHYASETLKFRGWYWYKDRAGGTFYAPGDSLTVTEDILLYALWEELDQVTLRYDANDGSGGVSSYAIFPGERKALPGSSQFTRFGYTLDGWNTAADGTGAAYAGNADFTAGEEDTTLYAQWKEIVEISERVYVGVVAFNNTTSEYALSNNLGRAKLFIYDKANDVDSTALCYAVTKATELFSADDSPDLDNLFVVSFTDGDDNFSSTLYKQGGYGDITQHGVYAKAKKDLEGITGMKSYAIGFGSSIVQPNMLNLVYRGQYRTASTSNLNTVFQDIAYTVLASSQNVELVTNNIFTTEEEPRYFKITVTAKGETTYSATLKCKLVGETFEIISDDAGDDADLSFDAPALGKVNGNKLHIPFNNLKYVRGGSEWYISEVKVQVSDNDVTYTTDTETSMSSTSNNTKKTGVVLVLDCSKSLGTDFASVKSAAYNFINTLRDAQD
jgi:uncharacterized repeat protein (TIGR02543 family)